MAFKLFLGKKKLFCWKGKKHRKNVKIPVSQGELSFTRVSGFQTFSGKKKYICFFFLQKSGKKQNSLKTSGCVGVTLFRGKKNTIPLLLDYCNSLRAIYPPSCELLSLKIFNARYSLNDVSCDASFFLLTTCTRTYLVAVRCPITLQFFLPVG